MPKTLRMLPKWLNFAKYGHTGQRLPFKAHSHLPHRSGLRQCRDRNFSISAEQCNRLPQTHAENGVM